MKVRLIYPHGGDFPLRYRSRIASLGLITVAALFPRDWEVKFTAARLESVALQEETDVVAMSALLTTTMTYMRDVVEELVKAKLKAKVKVIIGGAPISQTYADRIKADGYAPDAALAVDLLKKLLKK